MLSALRAAVAGGASTADPALPGISRARGLRLGRPAAVSSSGRSATAPLAASHPSSASVEKSAGVGSGRRVASSAGSIVGRLAGPFDGTVSGADGWDGGKAAAGANGLGVWDGGTADGLDGRADG